MYHTRIAILWLLAIVALFGYANLAAHEVPANLLNLSLVTDQELASAAIVMMALTFLSLILKGLTHRLTNIIGGSVVGLGFLAVLIDGVTVNPSGIYNLMMGAIVIFLISVVWFAYKMPRPQA